MKKLFLILVLALNTAPSAFVCNTPSSLLYGVTPGTYSTISGWSLGCSQDFEGENLINMYGIASCKYGDASFVYSAMSQTTDKKHTGSKSVTHLEDTSGIGGAWGMQLPNTSTEYYVSWYETRDSFPNYGGFYFEGGDLMELQIRDPDNGGDVLVNFCCDVADKGSDSADILFQTEAGAASEWSPTRFIKKVFADFDGHWHQWEVYFKPNTQTGGVANSNGILKIWHDGVLWVDWENYNLNGTLDLSGAYIAVLGVTTVVFWLYNANSQHQCDSLWQVGGPFDCAPPTASGSYGCANLGTWSQINAACPGQAPPYPFHRNLDDVILLYK